MNFNQFVGRCAALGILLSIYVMSVIAQTESGYSSVAMHREITHVQPMTGLVLWPGHEMMAQYQNVISMEFQYCLPCRVVSGKSNGNIQYDWTYLENILNDIQSRGHQAIIRFRYEYPNSKDVDGKRGTTAVPQYIKNMSDYQETYSANPGGDGPTYYADWSNSELQWFTKQFYTDFAARYNTDPRIAFVEIGFGHWSEYHIYGTKLQLGKNFPSKAYQESFLQHLDTTLNMPWAVSIDAADDTYTPIVANSSLLALRYGLFDDSFMHEGHEIGSGDGCNEENWIAIGQGTRWQKGVCGGEISYYTSNDQKNFLNPAGMYGVTWESASSKYHITFMIANDAPGSTYGTVARFEQAGMAVGYKLAVTRCVTNGVETHITVSNQGIAPLYRDAYFAIGSIQSVTSLRGLLPATSMDIVIPCGLINGDDLHIVSPYILPVQTIEFSADIIPSGNERCVVSTDSNVRKCLRNGVFLILRGGEVYDMTGRRLR